MSSNVIDRQTYVFSFNLATLLPSTANVPISLRFVADEFVLKSLAYRPGAVADTSNMVQIWCNKTTDNLITAFPNGVTRCESYDLHFRLTNTLQNETIVFASKIQKIVLHARKI